MEIVEIIKGLNELVEERQGLAHANRILIEERDNLIKELEKLSSTNGAVDQVEIFKQGIYFMRQCIHRIGNIDHTVDIDLSDYMSGLDISICGEIETTLNVSDLVGEYVGEEITDDEIKDIIKNIK